MSKSKAKAKPTMTDAERSALVEKLNSDLEDFVAEKSKAARGKKPDTRTVDEIAEELTNHPAFMSEIDWSKPLHPDLEGLMKLKYESEDPVARADGYRDDGNEQFKLKKYHLAIENYTEAIKSKSPDAEQNAILYANRAAAQYHLGNYRSSLNDCIFARKFKADHFKAIVRGSQCCHEMKKYGDAIRWCDAGLLIEPENKVLLSLRIKADAGKRAQERDERRQMAQERKEEAQEKHLLQQIQSRGIKLGSMKVEKGSKVNPLLLTNLESHNPTGAKVHLDQEGTLLWPVIFFYPEYAETDFISSFNENETFYAHLANMFGPDLPPAPWDEEHKYKTDDLEIYFENQQEEKLYSVTPTSTLLKTLQKEKYTVHAGTPGFIVLVKGSRFQQEFQKRYKS